MTYPGGQPDPQQPYGQQPYGQPQQPYQQPYQQQPYGQPPVSGQPYGQPDPYAQPSPYGQPAPYAYGPPPGGSTQKGGKWALIGIGGFLALVVLMVGGYFAFQKVFVDTPTEVVEAYLKEAVKDRPDAGELERYLCKEEATKLKKELSNDGKTSSSSDSTILDWHVTGETINGATATVYTSFTIKASSSGRTSTNTLNLTLVKENRAWKICGYDA